MAEKKEKQEQPKEEVKPLTYAEYLQRFDEIHAMKPYRLETALNRFIKEFPTLPTTMARFYDTREKIDPMQWKGLYIQDYVHTMVNHQFRTLFDDIVARNAGLLAVQQQYPKDSVLRIEAEKLPEVEQDAIAYAVASLDSHQVIEADPNPSKDQEDTMRDIKTNKKISKEGLAVVSTLRNCEVQMERIRAIPQVVEQSIIGSKTIFSVL